MQTYQLRDSRVARIETLLSTLPPDDVVTRPALERELDLLRPNSWRVSDAAFRAIGQDWLRGFTDPTDLTAALALDPANAAPLLTDEQAQRIVAIPSAPFGQSPDAYFALVLNAVDDDPVTGDSLLQSAHRSWLGTDAQVRIHPFDDVVVTLPVRLETLFDPPDSDRENHPDAWLLSLRVSPDEASIVRDFHYLARGERAPLEAFWNRVRQDGDPAANWLDGDLAEVAWTNLASQVGGDRAAWLVANIPVGLENDRLVLQPDPDLPDDPQPNWVRGMPPQLLVYADVDDGAGGTFQVDIGRLPQDELAVIDDEQLVMAIPRRPTDLDRAWWTSFERTCEIGLGGVFALDPGVDPGTIRTLYVVGVGDADPGEHFRKQADAGELSVVPLGTATNAVKDDPANPRQPPPDWKAIARFRLDARRSQWLMLIGATGQQLGQALTGSPLSMPAFPGHDARNDCADSQLMVQALWPALWGHWMKDVWGLKDPWGADSYLYEIGAWMMANLYPEGPLMPIRIGDQPYGLLPAVSLENWAPDWGPNPEDPTLNELLDAMRKILIEMRRRMVDAALADGNVVDGDVARFMRLLGNPVSSPRFSSRLFAPAELFVLPQNLDADALDALEQAAVDQYTQATAPFGFRPNAPYVTAGYWRPIRLPLVQPRQMLKKHREWTDIHRAWLEVFIERFEHVASDPNDLSIDALFRGFMYSNDPDDDGEWQLGTLPDSLLIRLMVYATQLATLWRADAGATLGGPEVIKRQHQAAIELARQLNREEWWVDASDQSPNPPAFGVKIPRDSLAAFERAFRATLDTASHRIDPFTIGFAWDRLQRAIVSDRQNFRLGVYGWVDGPFKGHPGPTRAGLLHTPSYGQTLAALILRDRFLSSGADELVSESNQNPWQMDITSNRARLAIEIAAEVRMGFHIYEVVGRLIEQIIGTPQDVRAMRQLPDFAMRAERLDPNEVVNGELALRRLLTGPSSFPLPDGSLYELSLDQLAAVQEIADALDVYADLLVSDGIMQLTQRQIDQAAASMDAAAGLGRPPVLQFVQTPPSGYQLSTTVLSALLFQERPTGDLRAVHPAIIADASVAAWAEDRFAGDWIWIAHPPGGAPAQSIARSMLGLDLLDALTVPQELVNGLVLRTLDLPEAEVEFPVEWRQMQEAVGVLGARPLLAADLGVPHDLRPAFDADALAELTDRYLALRATANALADDLDAAVTDQARATALRRVLPWGVVPASAPGDRDALLALLLGVALPAGATDPATLCQTASAMLRSRIAAGPLGPGEVLDGDAKPPPMPTSITEMANLIATFAAPNARLTVLARWPVDELAEISKLDLSAPEADLDEQWLTLVAATRANLARLEAMQLEIDPLLHAWTSSRGDPWRTGVDNVIAGNRQMRASESVGKLDLTPLTVAYAAADAWNGASVAVGMIDAFGEAIPMAERNTFAAFGFNAPASRPPQAILLAVPPRPRMQMDDAALLQIVRETRLSALARSTHIESLGELQAVLPASWLIADGPLAARLEPWPVRELGES